MRLFVILLLVALTAVRSFAGDVMAIQMSGASHAPLVAAAQPHADCMGSPGHSHGHGHDSAPSHAQPLVHAATPDDSQPMKDHCANCASCQACFTVALSTPVLEFALAAPRHVLPDARLTGYTSAVPALGQKPPIS